MKEHISSETDSSDSNALPRRRFFKKTAFGAASLWTLTAGLALADATASAGSASATATATGTGTGTTYIVEASLTQNS